MRRVVEGRVPIPQAPDVVEIGDDAHCINPHVELLGWLSCGGKEARTGMTGFGDGRLDRTTGIEHAVAAVGKPVSLVSAAKVDVNRTYTFNFN